MAVFTDTPDVIFARQQAFPCTVPTASPRVITSDLCDYKATELYTWAGLKDALRYAPRPIHYLTFRYPVKDSAGHTKLEEIHRFEIVLATEYIRQVAVARHGMKEYWYSRNQSMTKLQSDRYDNINFWAGQAWMEFVIAVVSLEQLDRFEKQGLLSETWDVISKASTISKRPPERKSFAEFPCEWFSRLKAIIAGKQCMGSGLFNRGAPKHPGILLRQYAQEYSPKRVPRLPSLETWKRIVKSDPHWAKLRETIDIKLDVESLINQEHEQWFLPLRLQSGHDWV